MFKNEKSLCLLTILGCITPFFSYAALGDVENNSLLFENIQQEKQITGVVRDKEGFTIPGAVITLKNTSVAIATDIDGSFSLNIPATTQKPTLIIEFMGYKSQEINVSDFSKSIIITLEQDSFEMDEIVVIGYGTAKKKDLTGAVSDIKGSEIAQKNSTNVSQALQGSAPGVMVTRSSGSPNATATINIRGITSIGDSSPLIIVDGVQVSSIDDVNSSDIEDITVLKDAASASIYGARAASGVILITTKRATKDSDTRLDYNSSISFFQPTALLNTVNPTRYMEMQNERVWNDGGNTEDGHYSVYPQDDIKNYYANHLLDPNKYQLTDWRNILLKKSATKETHSLSLVSGNEKISSRASLTYDNMGEIYEQANFKRIQARLNNTYRINEKLSADFDMNYTYSNETNPTINPIFPAIRNAPVYAAVWDDGRYADGKDGSNTYAMLRSGGTNRTWRNVLNGRIALHYEILDGLKLSAIVSPSVTNKKNKDFKKQVPYFASDNPDQFLGYMNGYASTKLSEQRRDEISITKQFLANYQKDFGLHSLNALAGYEDFYLKNELVTATGDYFDLSNFPYLDLAPKDYVTADGNAYETAYRSYFGRLMYDYNSKYYLQANIRYDGSSRFHPDHRWGAFPSISAGWALSEEKFLQNVDFLSFLKLRASWGQLGNERIGYYPYQSSIDFSSGLFYQGNEIVSGATAANVYYAVKDITWEVTETKNIGIDAQFFNGRLNTSFDYYKKETTDMLLELEIPDFIGFENPQQNAGIMHTTGWDFSLGWRDNINEFKYGIALNLSDSKTMMDDLGGIVFDGAKAVMAGGQFNQWYGYQSDGIYQTKEELENSAVINSTVSLGDIKYKDISGPDGVPDGKISPEYDRVLLDGSLPRYIYGATINGAYKGFDFSLMLQGVGKQTSYLSSEVMRPFQSTWTTPSALLDGNYWSHYNTAEQNALAQYPRLSHTGAENNNYETSDFWFVNGSYLRIKNITLGYTLPLETTEKIGIHNLRVFLSGNDLFTFNNYPDGWDPEMAHNSYISRSITFGLNVKF